MVTRLIILNGPIEGMSISLHPGMSMLLGRHPKCSLQFLDTRISNHHCRLFGKDSFYYVEDMGSTNGTYVNDEKIAVPHRLQGNDIIRIGDIRIQFIAHSADLISEPHKTHEGSDNQAKQDPKFKGLLGETIIGDYKILKKLGAGATSEIFKAHHIITGKTLALKVLHTYPLDEVSLQRFIQEVKICMKFNHPRIVKVHEFAMYQDRPILVMDYIRGISLEEYLDRFGAVPQKNALKIASYITQALRYIHQEGVIHRDINPANILINEQEEIKLIDFGLVKEHNKFITLTCQTLGTIRYIPPEQIDDAKSVDHRADIYALGATIYHLLSGKPPYSDVNGLHALVMRIAAGPPVPLHSFTDTKKSISTIVCKAMASDRDQRYQRAQDFHHDIVSELKKMRY